MYERLFAWWATESTHRTIVRRNADRTQSVSVRGLDVTDAVSPRHPNRWVVKNEGLTSPGDGGVITFDIPFWILLKRDEIINLVAERTVSPHVPSAAIRENRCGTSTASGLAAAMVSEQCSIAVHDINITELQHRITTQEGSFLVGPE